jgi:hypothetical protein
MDWIAWYCIIYVVLNLLIVIYSTGKKDEDTTPLIIALVLWIPVILRLVGTI